MALSEEERTSNPSCKLIRTGNKRILLQPHQRHQRCLTSKFSWILLMWDYVYLLLLCCLFPRVGALDTSLCTSPLGMESGDITDAMLSASSSFDTQNTGVAAGRVRVETNGGAWCPKSQIGMSDIEEWIQVDLQNVHVLTAIETQGRFGNGHGQEFSEFFKLSYFRPELNRWVRYRDITGNEIIKGNINTYLAHKTELTPPILASKIRVIPFSHHRRTVCMRIEIYGCQLRGGLVSYEMHQGSKRGENWNFYDQTYDGIWEGNYLSNGLGALTDGRIATNNLKDDYYLHERDRGWVGWRSTNSSSPVEIIFKFDSVREFSSVRIHTSNQFTKEVQVFSEARIHFSIGGKYYNKDAIVFQPKEDFIFEEPRNVEIKTPHRIGKYVKIQLYFAKKWILISEFTFNSQPAMGNFTEEVMQTQQQPTLLAPVAPVEDVPPQSQSDASESSSGGNRIPQEMINHIVIGQTPTLHEEWSSVTIVITAVVASFVSIIFVLLLILTAMLFRQKIKARGEIPGSRNGMPLHYGEHHLEFGYATPEDIRKAKITANVEYQEPFVDSQYPNFRGTGNVMSTVIENSSDSGVNVSGKGSLTQYYSCTLVSNPTPASAQDSANEYEYVPNEFCKLLPNQLSPLKSIPNSPATMSRTSSGRSNMKAKFRELGVPEIPKNHLRILKKLGNGAFGTVYIGELENGNNEAGNLVAVKQLFKNATEKDKVDFFEEIRLLSSLTDPNIAKVLGICCESEPHCVLLEFLELGDLCNFLRQNDTLIPSSNKKLSMSNLLHIASQIASAMCFLEIRNIVHRDLATRNCVVGKGLVVKITHFATDTECYQADYYRFDAAGSMPLPIRWMAIESLFMGKFSTKSDVWSFGVTMWEIVSYARHSPYPTMSNKEVITNLRHLLEESDLFEPLSKPHNCPKDIYQLMLDTWQRSDVDRPSFREIHAFLARKSLSHSNVGITSRTTSTATAAISGASCSSSFVEHYVV